MLVMVLEPGIGRLDQTYVLGAWTALWLTGSSMRLIKGLSVAVFWLGGFSWRCRESWRLEGTVLWQMAFPKEGCVSVNHPIVHLTSDFHTSPSSAWFCALFLDTVPTIEQRRNVGRWLLSVINAMYLWLAAGCSFWSPRNSQHQLAAGDQSPGEVSCSTPMLPHCPSNAMWSRGVPSHWACTNGRHVSKMNDVLFQVTTFWCGLLHGKSD